MKKPLGEVASGIQLLRFRYRRRIYDILVEVAIEQGNPCFCDCFQVNPPFRNEKKNAQVEDPFGRGQALQKDQHRQNQAGPDEDAAHPYFEVAEGEAQAGPDPAGFRWRLQEGSAHDSLRLTIAWSSLLEEGCDTAQGLMFRPPLAVRCIHSGEKSGLIKASEEVYSLPRKGRRPPASSRTTERKMEKTICPA